LLTLSDLIKLMPAVSFADEDIWGSAYTRRVSGATLANSFLHNPTKRVVSAHLLVSSIDAHWWAEPDRCMWALQTIARSKASALLIMSDKFSSKEEEKIYMQISRGARHLRFPLLLMRPGINTEEIILDMTSRAVSIDTEKSESEYLESLVDYLNPSTCFTTNHLTKLLAHVSRVVGGYAAVIAPDGTVEGRSQGWDLRNIIRGRCATSVSRIREGRIGAATLTQAGFHVQLIGVGTSQPRPVFAVARNRPFPLRTSDLINRTAAILAVNRQLANSAYAERELRQIVPLARLAVFTQLMSGHVTAARKLAESIMPGLLNVSHFQVFVLECPTRQRAEILRNCENILPKTVLAVESPINETHIVFIVQKDLTKENELIQQKLEAVTAQDFCYLGASRPVYLNRVREGHEMATQALLIARRLSGRSATYHGEHHLAHILDQRARSWANSVVGPLRALSTEEQRVLVTTVRQALRHGLSGAARQMRLNRKTIALRCKRVETLLEVDFNNIQDRAQLELALQLVDLPADPPFEAPPQLANVLQTSAAQSWAKIFLAPLQRDSRPLIETARTWVACNGRVETCAEQLGAHPNTVRNHLAGCEELLGQRIVGRVGGANDLVMALKILEHAEDMRDAAGSRSICYS
jgi:sugar diacid utilization regulator